MARSVVPLRLSDEERAAIAAAAAKERVSLSEFLRRAALLIAHRLELPRVEPEKKVEHVLHGGAGARRVASYDSPPPA